MKIQIDQNTYQEYQQYMEQKLYDQVESCIRNGDLKELKKLSSENKIDFTHDSGFLGILAAGKPEMLRFISEQSANLIKLYGLDILTAAIWSHNVDSAYFLAKEKSVDCSDLLGTNVYDYYVAMTGTEQYANHLDHHDY